MDLMYVVTGGTGHLGLTLVQTLAAQGKRVRVLCLPNDAVPLPSTVERVIGDMQKQADLQQLFKGLQHERLVVIHCAAVISIAAQLDPLLWAVNVTGTEQLLQECRHWTIEKFIYVSSVHAIKELPRPQEISEPTQFDPTWVHGHYAQSKAAATALVLQAAAQGLPACVVFPSGMIGPGNRQRHNHLTEFIEGVARGRWWMGVQGAYNFVDVRDVVSGILGCVTQGVSGAGYLLTGHTVTIQQLATLIAAAAGTQPPRYYVPAAIAQAVAPIAEWWAIRRNRPTIYTPYAVWTLQTNAQFSYRKAQQAFGYQPRPLQETIDATVASIQQGSSTATL